MKEKNKLMVVMVALLGGMDAFTWWLGLVYDPSNGKGMRLLAVVMTFVLLIMLWGMRTMAMGNSGKARWVQASSRGSLRGGDGCGKEK